ncbi:nucleoporin 88-like [Oppia nitens]|uniref:nucleoporin 88-like n=1 Tax=Oppia nitens TaxID=1686743 RepID=UPI0023DCA27C|nr:nucleoporin 88-like [Oppia nitens]
MKTIGKCVDNIMTNSVWKAIDGSLDWSETDTHEWPESANLLALHDNHLLVWRPSLQSISCLQLLSDNTVCRSDRLSLTNAPLFDVDSLDLCRTGRYLALCGSRGIHIVQLPPKLPTADRYNVAKEPLLCRSWPLAQRFFVCNHNIELLCSRWHPISPHDCIVLLTNDNRLRLFDIFEEETPEQIIDLSNIDINNKSITHFGVSPIAFSLGENAISFDFAPSISKCYDTEPSSMTNTDECLTPIYILRGNGDVLLVYSSFKYSYVSNTIFGPLTIRPPAEDNYGVDACSIICLDCVPPVLIIATSFGVLHHCIAIDSEDDLDSNHTLLPQPTLFVYETIELSLSLTTSGDYQDMSCLLRLHKDQMIPMRYFCSHSCGVHAISIPFISQLKSKDIQEFREEESIVEHLICTKSVAGSVRSNGDSLGSTVPLGIVVGVRKGFTYVLVMLSSGELLYRRLTPTYIAHIFDETDNELEEVDTISSDLSLPKINFSDYIKQLLKRNISVPLLKSKDSSNNDLSQNLELVLTTTDTLKTEYIQKYDLAVNAIEKRVKVLSNDKDIQFRELDKCLIEKDQLMDSLIVLIDKYDTTRERQEELSNRIDKVLENLQFQRPELSGAEIQLREELNSVTDKLSSHRNKLQQIKVKCKYQTQQNQQLDDNNGAQQQHNRQQRSLLSNQITIPSPNQIKSIKEMLANQSELITDLVQTLSTYTKNDSDL